MSAAGFPVIMGPFPLHRILAGEYAMKRFPVLPACVLLLGAGLMIPLFAKSPEVLKKSPVQDLAAEADELILEVKTSTATGEAFMEKKDDIRRTAGVLAALGHAISQHPESKSVKLSGSTLRDAALELAESKDQAAAQKAIQDLQAALEGTASMKASAAAWKDLISMDDLMHVVNTRNAKVRRSARRSRDPEADARNAQTIAVLTLVMAEQAEDYLSEEAEIKAWKKFAMDYHQGMTDLAAAFKAKDKAGIQKHLDLATKACDACHAKFRDTE